jgi:hypothetical protein
MYVGEGVQNRGGKYRNGIQKLDLFLSLDICQGVCHYYFVNYKL